MIVMDLQPKIRIYKTTYKNNITTRIDNIRHYINDADAFKTYIKKSYGTRGEWDKATNSTLLFGGDLIKEIILILIKNHNINPIYILQ